MEVNVPKILCVVLCGYERHAWITPELFEWASHVYLNMDFATLVTRAYNFIPAASARNFAADRSIKITPEVDWLLMIDNDMSPPENLLDAVRNPPADASVIVPRFHLWDGKAVNNCWGMMPDVMAALPDGPEGTKELALNAYVSLIKCGTGCIFIRPELFRKMKRPWFEYKYDAMGSMISTEDIVFCDRVIAEGHKIYGYTGVTVGHQHTVNLADINRAINYKFEPEPELTEQIC